MKLLLSLSLTAILLSDANGLPTWPSQVDELEALMTQQTGYRARGFSNEVSPCSYSSFGPGRQSSAEFIRLAFHDAATANIYFGTDGMDASILWETDRSENVGIFNESLKYMGNFYNPQVSMADLIALGLTTAVRSCGGPNVPLRAGRIDVTQAGSEGVPEPQNSVGTFINQFARLGFNTSEMIALTACGHTVGGVHSEDFPNMVAPNTVSNNYQAADSSIASFDNTIAKEWVSGKTTDPMAVGISVQNSRASDAKVFGADGNVTMRALTSTNYFKSTCSALLARMIEVVPSGVVLTDPVSPYDVKPVDLQLTLLDGGRQISFTGEIRVLTTSKPSIASVQLVYKDRTGAAGGSITAKKVGTGKNFDYTFNYYGFSSALPTSTSISGFNVVLQFNDGTSQTFDNNGVGYPVQDVVMLQAPQSCMATTVNSDGSRNLTIVAAVRSVATGSPSLGLTVRVPREVIVPGLQTSQTTMTFQSTLGPYSLYSITYPIPDSQVSTATFNITLGSYSDSFKNTTQLTSTCSPTPPKSTTPILKPSISPFNYNGCYTEASSTRALSARSTTSAQMTLELCATFCSSSSPYFGVEYGTQCYCGSFFNQGAMLVADSDCSFSCPGDASEFCGASNRLSTYYNPFAAVPAVKPVVGAYSYYNCVTELTNGRTLSGKSYTDSTGMTLESCMTFCSTTSSTMTTPYTFFGVEYSRECYCGNTLNAGSANATSAGECNKLCSGDQLEYCGGSSRLNVYALSNKT